MKFEMSLETLTQKILVPGDFNAKSKSLCGNGLANFEGSTIENIAEATQT